MKNNKKISKGNFNSIKKVALNSISSDSKNVIWKFDKIDRNGKFAFDINRPDFNHKEFLEKMINYSTISWNIIKQHTHDNAKSKHHFLDVQTLSKDAQDRIKQLHIEEYIDNIFSFAFTSKCRIIGIREDEYFYVLWYDPNHQVCVSNKKHTLALKNLNENPIYIGALLAQI